jgi:hypothetical protein
MPFPLQLKRAQNTPTDGNSALRLPAQKHVSLANSERLSSITEDGVTFTIANNGTQSAAPPIPRRSIFRAASGPITSARKAPPPYTWVPEEDNGEDGRVPIEVFEPPVLR